MSNHENVKLRRGVLMGLLVPALACSATTATVWRGETAYVDVPAGRWERGPGSAERDGVAVTFGYYGEVAYEVKPEVAKGAPAPKAYERRSRPDVWREWGTTGGGERGRGSRPAVVRISAAPGARPGKHRFGELEVTVLDRVLPPAKDWKFFLDLWQHPWAVSRFFNVKPFSKEHYAKMEPVWRALADCGCKALTVTLLDLPWNHQCYDGYHSMVGRVKNADGSWEFDYSLFDEYVEFGRRCGLGPDIACYTMCPWGYMATWKERGPGNGGRGGEVEKRERLLPGTKAFDDYWGPFLVDFAGHLKAKGWFGDAYIAMDERQPEDVRLICGLIQKMAPGLKVAMAGNKSPSEFEGIAIDNYSQGLVHLRKHPKFLDELAPRRARGCKTTFYVCCSPAHPNTFMLSPDDEGFWLGAYPSMAGFDGFLRWAANSWPRDPYKDASFKTNGWKAGDTYLIYPNGELSARLVALRAGIVAAEKMRILGERGEVRKAIADIAGRYGYDGAVRNAFDFSAFRREVQALVNAPADAAKRVP
ncbi:MAG: DUF4091 domain-containing protein [Kiritimatiellae bacterium]|nr:DUF4091 domain-containing protein [Kiritimatiellia bacterium]